MDVEKSHGKHIDAEGGLVRVAPDALEEPRLDLRAVVGVDGVDRTARHRLDEPRPHERGEHVRRRLDAQAIAHRVGDAVLRLGVQVDHVLVGGNVERLLEQRLTRERAARRAISDRPLAHLVDAHQLDAIDQRRREYEAGLPRRSRQRPEPLDDRPLTRRHSPEDQRDGLDRAAREHRAQLHPAQPAHGCTAIIDQLGEAGAQPRASERGEQEPGEGDHGDQLGHPQVVLAQGRADPHAATEAWKQEIEKPPGRDRHPDDRTQVDAHERPPEEARHHGDGGGVGRRTDQEEHERGPGGRPLRHEQRSERRRCARADVEGDAEHDHQEHRCE